MDELEVNIGRERTVEDTSPTDYIPILLNGSSQIPGQNCMSRPDDQPRDLKRRKSQFQLFTGFYTGDGSNSEKSSSLERHADESGKDINDMDAFHDESDLRLLFLSRNPKKKMATQELASHYDISYDFFVWGLISHIRDYNIIEGDQKALELSRIIHINLPNCEIPIWDFVRFLTKESQVKSGSQKFILRENLLKDFIYAERTLNSLPPKCLAAAVVVRFPETAESQGGGLGGLCRVRVIFGFPQEIRKILPDWIKRTYPRLAFVEWYSRTESSGHQFYHVSLMKNDRNVQVCGVIPITDFRGSVPLYQSNDGPRDYNTYLVDAASFQEVASANCQFDVLGRNYKEKISSFPKYG